MRDPYFFGYGSLVNTTTHDFTNPTPARLKGWKRCWQYTDLRPAAFLTARPEPDSEIEGLIAHVPGNDWDALDKREWAYDRVSVTKQVTHPLTQPVDIAVYAVPKSRYHAPDEAHPIFMSYLDIVVQGYLRVFGARGAQEFFETTDGWDTPILNDRADPRYPRAQAVSATETDFVDAQLRAISATLL